jgi:hypothetical protein
MATGGVDIAHLITGASWPTAPLCPFAAIWLRPTYRSLTALTNRELSAVRRSVFAPEPDHLLPINQSVAFREGGANCAAASWSAPVLWRFVGAPLGVCGVFGRCGAALGKSGGGPPHSKTLARGSRLLPVARIKTCVAVPAGALPELGRADRALSLQSVGHREGRLLSHRRGLLSGRGSG